MNSKELVKTISFGSWTAEELADIVQAVQYARQNLTRQNIRKISLNTLVEFHSTKRGRTVTGRVTKIGRKFLSITEVGYNGSLWRVPASLIKVV